MQESSEREVVKSEKVGIKKVKIVPKVKHKKSRRTTNLRRGEFYQNAAPGEVGPSLSDLEYGYFSFRSGLAEGTLAHHKWAFFNGEVNP